MITIGDNRKHSRHVFNLTTSLIFSQDIVFRSLRSQFILSIIFTEIGPKHRYCHLGLKWHSSLFGNNRKLVRLFAVI